ncbi:hypothetical protein B0H19DRAFT_1072247 [Mycena capillaripes]|nr:hypothetical protein B0H19DRAFT_1072247 [Mycena capillaripes]
MKKAPRPRCHDVDSTPTVTGFPVDETYVRRFDLPSTQACTGNYAQQTSYPVEKQALVYQCHEVIEKHLACKKGRKGEKPSRYLKNCKNSTKKGCEKGEEKVYWVTSQYICISGSDAGTPVRTPSDLDLRLSGSDPLSNLKVALICRGGHSPDSVACHKSHGRNSLSALSLLALPLPLSSSRPTPWQLHMKTTHVHDDSTTDPLPHQAHRDTQASTVHWISYKVIDTRQLKPQSSSAMSDPSVPPFTQPPKPNVYHDGHGTTWLRNPDGQWVPAPLEAPFPPPPLQPPVEISAPMTAQQAPSKIKALINQKADTCELSDSEFNDAGDADAAGASLDDIVEVVPSTSAVRTAVACCAPSPPLRHASSPPPCFPHMNAPELVNQLSKAFDPKWQRPARMSTPSAPSRPPTCSLYPNNSARVHDAERAQELAELKLQFSQTGSGPVFGGASAGPSTGRHCGCAAVYKDNPDLVRHDGQVHCERLYAGGGACTQFFSDQLIWLG